MPATIKTSNLPVLPAATEVLANNEEGGTVSTGRLGLARLAVLLAASEGPSYSLKADLAADLDWPAGSLGKVYGDIAANNGVYEKAGDAGAGDWNTRLGDLPAGIDFSPVLDRLGNLEAQGPVYAATSTALGNGTFIAPSNIPAASGLTAGMTVVFIPHLTSSAYNNQSRLQLLDADGGTLPTVGLRTDDGGAWIGDGALIQNRPYVLHYDGTWFKVVGEVARQAMAATDASVAALDARVTSVEAAGAIAFSNIGGAGDTYIVDAPLDRTTLRDGTERRIIGFVPDRPNTPNTVQTYVEIRGDASAVRTRIVTADGVNPPTGSLLAGKEYLLRWIGGTIYLNLTLDELTLASAIDANKVNALLADYPPQRTRLGGDHRVPARLAAALSRDVKTRTDPFGITFDWAYYLTHENVYQRPVVKPVAGKARFLTSVLRAGEQFPIEIEAGASALFFLDGAAADLPGWRGADIPAGAGRQNLEVTGPALVWIYKYDDGSVMLQLSEGVLTIEAPQTSIVWDRTIAAVGQSRADYMMTQSGLFSVQKLMKEQGISENIRFVKMGKGSTGLIPGNGSAGDQMLPGGTTLGPVGDEAVARLRYAIETEGAPVPTGIFYKWSTADGNWAGKAVPASRSVIIHTTYTTYLAYMTGFIAAIRNADYGLANGSADDIAMKAMTFWLVPGGSRDSSFAGDTGNQIILEAQLACAAADGNFPVAYDDKQYRSSPGDVHNQDSDHVAAGEVMAEFLHNEIWAGDNYLQPEYVDGSINQISSREVQFTIRYFWNYPIGELMKHPLLTNRYLAPEGLAIISGDYTSGRVDTSTNTEDTALENLPVPISHIAAASATGTGDFREKVFTVTTSEDLPSKYRLTLGYGMYNVFAGTDWRDSRDRIVKSFVTLPYTP